MDILGSPSWCFELFCSIKSFDRGRFPIKRFYIIKTLLVMSKVNSILDLINKLRFFIIKLSPLFLKTKTLISFSGGQDSICLLFLLLILKRQLSLSFELIYCDHLWNLNSLYKFLHISKLSFNLEKNIIFIITPNKVFNEKSARNWRYSTIYRSSQFYNSKIVLTAHTRTDQLETLLLNLFRGSGKGGLSIFSNRRFITSKSIKETFLSEDDLNL